MKLKRILQVFSYIIPIIIFIGTSVIVSEIFLESYIGKESYLKYKQIPKDCKATSIHGDFEYVCDKNIDSNYLNIPNNKKWALGTGEIYTIYIILFTLFFFYLVIIVNYNKTKTNLKNKVINKDFINSNELDFPNLENYENKNIL